MVAYVGAAIDRDGVDAMSEIFGYSWADIQRAQQGGRLARPVVRSAPQGPSREDIELLQIYGADELRAQGFHGTLDRLQRAGLI